jgi:hypothetical protein
MLDLDNLYHTDYILSSLSYHSGAASITKYTISPWDVINRLLPILLIMCIELREAS